MYRNVLKPVCSTGSHTEMKKLPPLPLRVASILLLPNCTQVGKTLGSAYRWCAAVPETQRGARGAGGFALLMVMPCCPPARGAVPGHVGTCGMHDSLASEGQLKEPFQMHWEQEERQPSIGAASDLVCIAEVRLDSHWGDGTGSGRGGPGTGSGQAEALAESKEQYCSVEVNSAALLQVGMEEGRVLEACGFILPPAPSPAALPLGPRGAASCPGFLAARWCLWSCSELHLLGASAPANSTLKSVV